KARLPRVEEWVAQVQPDVLCMQETKMADGDFPLLTFQGMGYEAVHHGEGRWNGVAILSRVGIDDVVYGFADGIEPDTDARLVTATCGGIRVTSVYVPNGRSLDDDHYQYKLSWLGRLRTHLDAVADPSSDVVVLGDWNIAPEDRDVYDPKVFEGATHVSDHERKALDEIKGFGLIDVFRQRYEAEGLYSWWDYRGGNFHKKMGLRIDYLLASRSLAARSVSDLVDRNARKGQKPSDHAPVLGLFADQ
ncbi:MAG: exodeoxyribonuclease III, partial [Acidimicrobiales bacterium]